MRMLYRFVWFFCWMLVLSLGVVCRAASGEAGAPPIASQNRILEAYGQLPLSFEINQGQTDPQVKFLSRGEGYSLFLTEQEAVLALAQRGAMAPGKSPGAAARRDQGTSSAVLRFKLAEANPHPVLEGTEVLPGHSNYFKGKDPAAWRTDLAQYARVKAGQVYRGIDLVYYGNQRLLEYDFLVAPGADPAAICFQIEGADDFSLDAEGNLHLQSGDSEVVEKAPVIYQEENGERRTIAGSYIVERLTNDSEGSSPRFAMRFRVAEYDRAKPLVIDPVVAYCTYFGGVSTSFNLTGKDTGTAIAVDSTGVYIAGRTLTDQLPVSANAFQKIKNNDATNTGEADAFVAKLDPTGTKLQYCTYLGGNSDEGANGIAVDSSGQAYVVGYTASTNFPVTATAFQSTYTGNIDNAFVTVLNNTGSGLVYSTYLGGNDTDIGQAIAVKSPTQVFVTGHTNSIDFPTTPTSFEPDFAGNGAGFVILLNPKLAGAAGMVYGTFLTAADSFDTGLVTPTSIAVDSAGDAYVAGSASIGFVTTPLAYEPTFQGAGDGEGNVSGDCFVIVLNPLGHAPIYSTYLGGSQSEQIAGIAIDSSGRAYVAGQTYSSDFPTTNGAYSRTFTAQTGLPTVFVSRLSKDGSTLEYSTFLGGTWSDEANGIAIDQFDDAYVVGQSSSKDFPVTAGSYGYVSGSQGQGFVTKLNSSGSALLFSSYFGGTFTTIVNGVTVDSAGNAYIIGTSNAGNKLPLTNAYQSDQGGDDGTPFLAKLNLAATAYTVTPVAGAGGTISPSTPQSVLSGSSIPFTATPNAGNVVHQWLVNNAVKQTGGTSFTLSDVTANATVEVTFAPPSNVSTLSALTVSSGTLSPAFNSTTPSYALSVTNATATLTVTPTVTASSGAMVTVGGTPVASGTASSPISLSVGSNTIPVVVTAQNLTTTTTYTLNVTRETAPAVTTLAVTALTATSATLNATVDANGATTTASFNYGKTATYGSTIAATPASVTGSTATGVSAKISGLTPLTTYYFQAKGVSAAGTGVGGGLNFTTPNNVATLSGLISSSGPLSPVFSSATISYTATVSNTTPSITLTPTVTDPNARVAINGVSVGSGSASSPINLNVGSNTIAVVVTAQDGLTTKTYTLKVTRTPLLADMTTLTATSVGTTTATLNGTAVANNAPTTLSFDYGTSSGYGSNIAATPST
ncbi:MAG TPA: SBBP repeat-containing protein, partial [Chthoniobacter sp.]